MASSGLDRSFAMVVGSVLVVLGVLGSLGSPIVGGPTDTGIIITGFGHDLTHLVTGALFLHVGVGLNGRNRGLGLVGLGIFFVVTGILSLVMPDLLGLYDERTSGLDQLGHVLIGVSAIVVGWMGRGVERREFGRAASRPIPGGER